MMSYRFHKFKGTHKEIGQQVAELYKQWGRIGITLIPNAGGYFDYQLEIYEKYFPRYIEYIEGLALGLNIDKDLAIKSLLTIYLDSVSIPKNTCSSFALKNSNGIFIGRNYDWTEIAEPYSSSFEYDFTDGSANNFTANSDMGIFKKPNKEYDPSRRVLISDDAWNNHGLYISLNGAPSTSYSAGMTTPHIVQCVAEICKTVDEAISLIEKIPITESKIFLVADKSGSLAVVERHAEKGIRVRSSDKFVIATNHYLHEDFYLENAIMFEKTPFHSSFPRYSYLDIILDTNYENFDFEDVSEIMLTPPLLQNWRGDVMGDVITNWSLSLELSIGKSVTLFSPLKNPEEVSLP